jgi:hypothetical protein
MASKRPTRKQPRKAPRGAAPPPRWLESWQVVVECRDEDQQRQVYQRLSAEGFKCRLIVM